MEKLWGAPPSVPVTPSNSQAKAAAPSWWQELSDLPFVLLLSNMSSTEGWESFLGALPNGLD